MSKSYKVSVPYLYISCYLVIYIIIMKKPLTFKRKMRGKKIMNMEKRKNLFKSIAYAYSDIGIELLVEHTIAYSYLRTYGELLVPFLLVCSVPHRGCIY